jgi:hypothetical protein
MIIKNFLLSKGLILILIVFLLVGMAGLFFDYSLNTGGDESVIMAATMKMISEHSLRPNFPTFYHVPMAVYFYLIPFILFFVLLRLTGVFMDLNALREFGILNIYSFLPLARFLTLLMAMASIYILYKLSQKLFNDRRISLLAAFFLAFSLLFVQISHTARVWIPQVMTILLAFYLINILYQNQENKIKDYLYAALGIGLSFGTHVVGVFTYLPFLIIHYYKNKSKKLKEIFLTNKYFWLVNLVLIICYLLTFYLNTYGFRNYINKDGNIWPNLSFLYTDSGTSVGLNSDNINLFDRLIYFSNALIEYEPLLVMLALAGFIVIFFKQKRIFYLLVPFMLVFYISVSFIGLEQHYILPIIPFLALAAGYGLISLYDKMNKTLALSLISIIMLIIFFPPLVWTYRMNQPSTRLEARDWIYKNIPASSSIINFDPRLELNENQATLTDIKNYTTGYYSKKRSYLLSKPAEEYPQPNYYVLNYTYFDILPEGLLNKKYDYLLVYWNNQEDLRIALNKAKNFKSNPTLLKRFPESADENSQAVDMREDMVKPIWVIFNVKIKGPIIDIYKLE